MDKIITELDVKNIGVRILRVDNIDYVSLTDLAKYQNSTDPSFTIKSWMRTTDTVNFIGLWEKLNNRDFNFDQFNQIKSNYGTNSFYLSPSQWVKRTNAIGIKPSAGKYSIGTFAHPDIAFEFASWLSAEFKLYLITEFERLKKDESYQNQIDWSMKREFSKTNYLIHTNSIKKYIVPTLTDKQKQFVYANEADVLNVALFGMTAKEWRDENSEIKGNIRDYADILELIVLINLENLNANMISKGLKQKKRLEELNKIAKEQMELLKENKNVKKIGNTIEQQRFLNGKI